MKRKFLAALAIALALAWAQAACAGVTVANNNTTGTTNSTTTISNCNSGGGISVFFIAWTTTATAISSVTDSSSNSYVVIDDTTGTGLRQAIAYSIVTSTYNSGATYTVTFGGSVTSTVEGVCTTIINGSLDRHANTATGSAATSATTVNTGVMRNASNWSVFGFTSQATTQGSTQACGTGWTAQTNGLTAPGMLVCLQTPGANASLAFSPTWSTSSNYVSDVMDFANPALGCGTSLALAHAGC